MNRLVMLACGSILAGVAIGGTAQAADLNHNGRLDTYENPRAPVEKRLDDLIGQMTLAEKVGTLLHGTLPLVPGKGGQAPAAYNLDALRKLLAENKVNSFITRITLPPADFAAADNAVQQAARETRLGIPVTISTDPRNHFNSVIGASNSAGAFSRWPEFLGMGALDDPATTRRFGQVVAAEYRAVGIQMALGPQVDLFTEPRWGRGVSTFGSDYRKVSVQAGAYIEGLQGGADGVHRGSVLAVTKHWAGYGAQPDGLDGHNAYGARAVTDQKNFELHVAAFDGALAAHTAGIIPAYPVIIGPSVDGKPLERVGPGFSHQMLTDLLRGTKGYRGLILSDWNITADCGPDCEGPTREHPQGVRAIAMPWGVETLTTQERFVKGIDAGIDQFGGTDDPAPLLAAVHEGKVTPGRIDQSVRQVLRLKFELGLFDNPFVDPARAKSVVGSAASQAIADKAQREAMVLLKNADAVLPLHRGTRVWLSGINAAAARAGGLVVVDRPEQAQVALVRTTSPAEMLHPWHFFGAHQAEGRIDLRTGDEGFDALMAGSARVPAVLAVDMIRPTVLTAAKPHAAAMLALFGASDAALVDVLTGKAAPKGHLPTELPRSMQAVVEQDPAAADDSVDPLFPRGFGLNYPATR
jgi:beta-glucosidase